MRDFIGRGGAALYMKTIDIITTYNLLKAQCEESYNRVKEAERIAKSDIEYITKDENRNILEEHSRIFDAFDSFRNHDWK